MENRFFYDNKNSKLYTLDGEGYLYSYNYDTRRWFNVSSDVALDFRWSEISSEQAVNFTITPYINYSLTLEIEEERKNKAKIKMFGKKFSFYKFGKMVCAVDEYDNQFKCLENYMTLLRHPMVDKAWKKVDEGELFLHIALLNGNYDFCDMDVYQDENDDYHGFYYDGTHFRVSSFSGDVFIEEGDEVSEDWIAISEDYIKDCDEIVCKTFPKVSRFDLEKLNIYIDDVTQNYNSNHKDKMGSSLMFFEDSFGKVYACDELDNEFICKSKCLIKAKKGTINEDSVERILNIDVVNKINSYTKRSRAIKKGEVTLYDLCLFKTDMDEICGICENEKAYILCENGELEECDRDECTCLYDSTLMDAIVIQAERRYHENLKPYLEMCKRRLNIRHVELGEDVKFFTNEESVHKNVYAKDNKKNEYLCDKYKMVPIEKGTIKKSFTPIDYSRLSSLLNVVVIVE